MTSCACEVRLHLLSKRNSSSAERGEEWKEATRHSQRTVRMMNEVESASIFSTTTSPQLQTNFITNYMYQNVIAIFFFRFTDIWRSQRAVISTPDIIISSRGIALEYLLRNLMELVESGFPHTQKQIKTVYYEVYLGFIPQKKSDVA